MLTESIFIETPYMQCSCVGKIQFATVHIQHNEELIFSKKSTFQTVVSGSRKVIASISDEVIIFFNVPNPSSCSMAVVFNEMCIKNLPAD
jgi:hypothetical protein